MTHLLEEDRATVARFGSLPADSPDLERIPGTDLKIHRLVLPRLQALEAAVVDAGIVPRLVLASAWRPHRWDSREEYEAALVRRYGTVAEGRRWLAYHSPHETGRAIDIRCGGLEPRRASADKQRTTRLYRWLAEHAREHGWTPYLVEPWHWECSVA